MSGPNITIPNRELFRINLVIAVIVSLLLILFSIMTHFVLFGFIPIFLILTKTTGAEIDPKRMRYRKYNSLLWLKHGKWKRIPLGASLVILTKHGSKTTKGSIIGGEYRAQGIFHELYLMSRSHRSRFYLDSGSNPKRIKRLANDISEKCEVPIQRYNPN